MKKHDLRPEAREQLRAAWAKTGHRSHNEGPARAELGQLLARLTKKQARIWALRQAGFTFPEIVKNLGGSRYAAMRAYEAAEKKLRGLRG